MRKIFLGLICFCFLLAGCGKLNGAYSKVVEDADTYKLNFDYNHELKEVQLSEELLYKNDNNMELKELYFHLYPNAFAEGVKNKPVGVLNESKAYPNGKSYGGIEVNSVVVDGESCEVEYYGEDNDFLKINLTNPLKINKKITVQIDALIKLPNINHRFGYGNNTINIANTYPIIAKVDNGEWVLNSYHSNGDPFYSDIANYEVDLTAPSNLILASTGEILKTKEINGENNYKIKAEGVRDYAFVLSDEFKVVSEKINGVDVNYYYFDDDNFQKSLETSVKSLSTFSELFGEYPYKVLNVVQANFVHGGMEYPNLVYISNEVENELDYNNVIIHEIAHQWWYGVVGNNEYTEAWLDEGLTEYSVLLFYENNATYGVDIDELIKSSTNNYALFVELYTKVLGEVNTSMNRSLNEFDTEPEYVYNVYIKGMLFFDNIREMIGDKDFFKGLKEYYAKNAFTNATSQNLLMAFEKVSGKNLEGLFDSWINGKISILSVE